MDVVFTPCAGLDGPKKTVMACRVTPDPMGQQADGFLAVREFGTLTRELLAWSDGLTAAGITPVAMESTGAYGQPVYHRLEGTCTVCLVNAAPVRNVPGRKTDRAEARWLATRMRYGLLQASGMPPMAQRDRRDRTQVVPERTREINRVQGVLERAHSKLASVATDRMGGSGRADPATMAELATGRVRRKMPVLAQALTGLVRDHHRRLLALPVAPLDCRDAQREALSTDMTRLLTDLSAAPTPPSPAATVPPGAAESASQFTGPALPLPSARAVTVLDTMPGGEQRGAERLVAAWGIDRGRFETAARLAAWSGVAPGNDDSAGTQRSGKTRKGHRALRTGLTPLAQAAALPKGTSVSAWSHRLAARRGKQRAIMAVAHSIVVSAFHMLSRHEPSHELGATYVDEHPREPLVDRLTRRLEHLGSRVSLEPVPAA